MNEDKRFWMVFCDGGNSPVQKHGNMEDSFKEAKRISSKTGKTTFVLQVIGGYEIPTPEPSRFLIDKSY